MTLNQSAGWRFPSLVVTMVITRACLHEIRQERDTGCLILTSRALVIFEREHTILNTIINSADLMWKVNFCHRALWGWGVVSEITGTIRCSSVQVASTSQCVNAWQKVFLWQSTGFSWVRVSNYDAPAEPPTHRPQYSIQHAWHCSRLSPLNLGFHSCTILRPVGL